MAQQEAANAIVRSLPSTESKSAPKQILKRLGVVVELENSEKPALVAEWLRVSLIHD